MEIHNMMEDLVMETVHEIFDELSPENFPLVHCYQCRLDVACYVLNRLKPEYIISGRGLVHFESDYQDKIQKKADLVALVNEGIRKINLNRRPYYGDSPKEGGEVPSPPVFNFPAIVGRILHGKTFEPLGNILAHLKSDGEMVPMIDYTWQNPYYVVDSIQGNFTFFPRPIKAEKAGEQRNFNFEICIDADGFSPLRHYFELEVASSNTVNYTFNVHNTFRVGELYLFPEDEPMEKIE
ncbi:MAG: late competence development ComFB family protein [Spirochaetaceae bacterium]